MTEGSNHCAWPAPKKDNQKKDHQMYRMIVLYLVTLVFVRSALLMTPMGFIMHRRAPRTGSRTCGEIGHCCLCLGGSLLQQPVIEEYLRSGKIGKQILIVRICCTPHGPGRATRKTRASCRHTKYRKKQLSKNHVRNERDQNAVDLS